TVRNGRRPVPATNRSASYETRLEYRVGRGVTPAALSHHRTCGTAYGGSTNTLEPLLSGPQRGQPHAREVGRGERQIHMRGAGIPPRTTAVVGAQPGAVRSESARKQLANPCSPALPLPPEQAAHPSSQPAIELLKYPLGLRQTEVIDPSP